MSFLRPEARAALERWRLPLIGSGVTALGLYWGLASFGLLQWVGWIIALAAGALTVNAVQQVRFRGTGEGPGVVQVTEGQIAYFGPTAGGAVSTDLLHEVAILHAGTAHEWELVHESGPPLRIPADARDAEALFDAFGALPGVSAAQLIDAVRDPTPGRRVVWQRTGAARFLPKG